VIWVFNEDCEEKFDERSGRLGLLTNPPKIFESLCFPFNQLGVNCFLKTD
jgi:hypothetical protein